MIIEDRRTYEQRETHKWLVVATDRFLSGWGQAKGGTSVCAWACTTHMEAAQAMREIGSRSDMRRTRLVYDGPRRYRPRTPCKHFSVYIYKAV